MTSASEDGLPGMAEFSLICAGPRDEECYGCVIKLSLHGSSLRMATYPVRGSQTTGPPPDDARIA
jgi:hypothetical protein